IPVDLQQPMSPIIPASPLVPTPVNPFDASPIAVSPLPVMPVDVPQPLFPPGPVAAGPPPLMEQPVPVFAAPPGLPPGRPRERNHVSVWTHLVPAGVLALGLLFMIVHDLIWGGKKGEDYVEIDPTPQVKPMFNDEPNAKLGEEAITGLENPTMRVGIII